MLTPLALTFIQTARSKGQSDDAIRSQLVQAGWKEIDIDTALGTNSTPDVPKPLVVTSDATMWDAFEHILLFISLYVLATSIALMIHSFVDKFAPDITQQRNMGYMQVFNAMFLRGYMAAVIVTYPLFGFLFLKVTKRTHDHPTLRKLKSRKILIYLTLIGTFLIALANIVGVVLNLLNGNITVNFILHFITTVGISSCIFSYYFFQVREDQNHE